MAVALVTVAGEADADGEAVTGAFAVELLTGSPAQPAATIERATTSPKIYLLVFILFSTSVIDCYRHGVGVSVFLACTTHLVGLLALVLGDGDAAGDGLTAGLGLFVGTLPVALLGDVAGAAVVGVFELSAGSQPATKMSEHRVRARRAVRLIMFMLGEFISLWPRFSKIEKHADDCPRPN